MTDPLTPGGQEWLGDLREILARTPDVLDHRRSVAAGWRALAAADRRRAVAELTPGEREWLRAVLDEALGVDLRAVTEPGAWATAAESLAWDVRYLRDRVEALGIAEWASPMWAQLSAAETLLDTAREDLASPPPTDGVDDVSDLDDLDADAAILAGLDAATGSSPDHPRVEEMEGEERVNPTDERAALVAALRPRIHDALDEAAAGLSLPELRALAAHPDAVAALLLLAGLAARAEAAIPEVTPEAAVPQDTESGPARGDPDTADDLHPRPDDPCDTCGYPRSAHPVTLRGGFTCQRCRDRPDGRPWRRDEVGSVAKRRREGPRSPGEPQGLAE